MTIKEALNFADKKLKEQNVEGPEASARFLLSRILNKDKAYLLAHPEEKLSIMQLRKFKTWVKRRAKHEPVWYIVGEIEFFGQVFSVNNDVLVPRPETELILERIISDNKDRNNLKVLDIGTGSGAIILSLAKNLNCETCSASDISKKALSVARKNAKRLGHQVVFKNGDLLSPWLSQKFDLVVANLPYVPHEDMSGLAFDLIHHEPRTALDGGSGGLVLYERFFDELKYVLRPGARIYCEIGAGQGKEGAKLAKQNLKEAEVEIFLDYAGHDRAIIIKT